MAGGEKYLVLGSNSFSGASFVDYLLEQGRPVIGCQPLAGTASGVPAVPMGGSAGEIPVLPDSTSTRDLDAIMRL